MKKLIYLSFLAFPLYPLHAETCDLAVIATLKMKTGTAETLRKAVGNIIEDVRREDGNCEYFFHQSVEDPSEFTFYERWRNEDALKAHLATKHMTEFFEATKGFLEPGYPQLKKLTPIDFRAGNSIASIGPVEASSGIGWGGRPYAHSYFVLYGADVRHITYCDRSKFELKMTTWQGFSPEEIYRQLGEHNQARVKLDLVLKNDDCLLLLNENRDVLAKATDLTVKETK